MNGLPEALSPSKKAALYLAIGLVGLAGAGAGPFGNLL